MAPSDQEPGQFKEQAAISKPRMVTSCTLGTATATFALLPEPKSWLLERKVEAIGALQTSPGWV